MMKMKKRQNVKMKMKRMMKRMHSGTWNGISMLI